jgi:D-sedoheptulose 7-phosphate isomerase
MKKTFPLQGNETFLTPKEAAKFLNLSLSTIKNYLYHGKLRAFKTPGGHYRINKKDLMRMMRSNSIRKSPKKISLNGLIEVLEEEQKSTLSQIKRYFSGLGQILLNIPLDKIKKMVDLLFDAYLKERQVFIMGNGGSAATASHFMVDLSKQTICGVHKRFKVISLSDNIPSMTAWANDASYEDIFVEQLKNLCQPGSLVIALSASGNSENVLRAVEFARNNGAITIGLTGFEGGRLKDMADEAIIVPSNLIGQIEDVHLSLVHVVCNILREKVNLHCQQLTDNLSSK